MRCAGRWRARREARRRGPAVTESAVLAPRFVGPLLNGGPVPGRSAADGPVGFGQHSALTPDVSGVPLNAEPVSDLDEAHGVADVHAIDCTESLDNMQQRTDNQYMTNDNHISNRFRINSPVTVRLADGGTRTGTVKGWPSCRSLEIEFIGPEGLRFATHAVSSVVA